MNESFRHDHHYSLSPVTEKDLDLIRQHRNNLETSQYLTSSLPIFSQQKWFENMGNTYMYFMINHENDGDVGLARITDIDWQNKNCAVGLDLFEEFRHQKRAKECFKLIVNYGFDILNMHRLWLMVVPENEAAFKVYKDVGFYQEGRLLDVIYRNKRYYDYVVMAMLEFDYYNEKNSRCVK